MLRAILAGACLLALEAPLAAETKPSPMQIAGRWQGPSYQIGGSEQLTLDIVACAQGWCGILIAANDTCGGTALRLDAGRLDDDTSRYEGTLQLAPGTEPYTVHASLYPPQNGRPMNLQITGDTGGEFRAYRRTFPFDSGLVRVKDAVCHAPATVSSLEQK